MGLQVELIQGEQTWPVEQRSFEPRPFWAFWGDASFEQRWNVQIGRNHQKELMPGEAVLRVSAERAATWLRQPDVAVTELPLTVKLTPPDLTIDSVSALVHQGGSGAVVYRVGEGTARHGLRVKDREIEGDEIDGDRRFLLFGAPHDLEDGASEMKLFVEDELGNRLEQGFLKSYAPRTFPADDIRLSDAFFEDVVPEILAHTPSVADQGDMLKTYLLINDRLRLENSAELVELGDRSVSKLVWQGAFTQLPSSRAMAGFGDHRTYLYDQQPVDQQVHLGFDLASRRRAQVPAANHGVVVLAKYFGIYGKTVVLDHGYGLMTLYSHLSEISVDEGAELKQGEILGRTGATGLAGGDHLHFSVLIHGVQVNPLEWWDEQWIENRILSLIEEKLAP